MTISHGVGRVIEGTLLPWEFPEFILRWTTDETALEIWEREHAIPGAPITTVALPGALDKSNNEGNWNKPPGNQRPAHHLVIGPNTAVDRHSIIVNKRFKDSRNPYLVVWDWRADTLHGPLVMPSTARLLAGPIKIGLFLYFVAVDETDLKARLFRTNFDLTKPGGPVGEIGAVQQGTETAAINGARSIEHFMTFGDFVGFVVSPSSGNFTQAFTWNHVTPGAPFSPASVTCGDFSYIYTRHMHNDPGRSLLSNTSFFCVANIPYKVEVVSATALTTSTLRGVGDWGPTESLGSNFLAPQFTMRDDGLNAFITYTDAFGDFAYQERVWETGEFITAETFFDTATPAGTVSMLFPFED